MIKNNKPIDVSCRQREEPLRIKRGYTFTRAFGICAIVAGAVFAGKFCSEAKVPRKTSPSYSLNSASHRNWSSHEMPRAQYDRIKRTLDLYDVRYNLGVRLPDYDEQ